MSWNIRSTFVLISIYLFCVSALVDKKQNVDENGDIGPISDIDLEDNEKTKTVKFVINSSKWPFLKEKKDNEIPIEKEETGKSELGRNKRQVKGYPQHYQNPTSQYTQQPYGGYNNTYNPQPGYPSNTNWNSNSFNRTNNGYGTPSYKQGRQGYYGHNPQSTRPQNSSGGSYTPRPGLGQYVNPSYNPQQNYYGNNQTFNHNPSQRPYSANGYLGYNSSQQHQGYPNPSQHFGQFNNTSYNSRFPNNTAYNPSQTPPYSPNGSFNQQNGAYHNPGQNPYQPYNNTNFGTPSRNTFQTYPGGQSPQGYNPYPSPSAPNVYQPQNPYGQNGSPSYPQIQDQHKPEYNGPSTFTTPLAQPNSFNQGYPNQAYTANSQHDAGFNKNGYGNSNNYYPTKGGHQGNGNFDQNHFYNPSQRNDGRDPTKVSPHEFNAF